MQIAIQFQSLTCGPCVSQGDWFEWETYNSPDAAEKAMASLKMRYGKKYAWRFR